MNNKNNPPLNFLPKIREEGYKQKAFTLVELIVVITILAILGTIAFISLQGYSATSRDSVRISDTGNMKTALELFHLDAGKYPLPDNYATAQYLGDNIFYQGTFGETVQKNVSRNMGEIPTDPLTEQEYIYSVSSNKNELEILSLMEGDDFALNTIPQTNAAGITVIPRIIGNYNGLFVKTPTYIVPLPSIINTEIEKNTPLTLDDNNVKSMITNKGKNIPNQGNVVSATGQLINFTLTGALNNLTKDSSATQKAAVINTIKSAYATETQLNTAGVIEYITNLENTEIILASVFDTVVLNNSVASSSSSSGGGNPTVTLKTVADCTTNGVIYGTEDGTDTGLTCDNDIIVCSGAGAGYTIAACNIGATTASTDWNISRGKYFQWGRNKGFAYGDTTQQATQILNASYDPNNDTAGFVWNSNLASYRYDWIVNQDDNLWGNNSGAGTDEQRQGPCPTGYHVPSQTEWSGIVTAGGWGTTQGTAMQTALKLPYAGYRNRDNGTFYYGGSFGYYWSSSPNGSNGYYLYFISTSINPSNNNTRAGGFSVRCFKN